MRLRISLGILVVLGLGLALKLRLLSGLVGEETLRTVAAIDVAAAVLLFIFAVTMLTSHLTQLREVVRSLVAFMSGRREQRVPVRGGGVMADLGRYINELLSEETGGDEMSSSTPGFRRVVRPSEATDPKLRAEILGPVGRHEPSGLAPNPGEGVGPVRVRPRSSQVGAADVELPGNDTEVSGPRDAGSDAGAELGPEGVSSIAPEPGQEPEVEVGATPPQPLPEPALEGAGAEQPATAADAEETPAQDRPEDAPDPSEAETVRPARVEAARDASGDDSDSAAVAFTAAVPSSDSQPPPALDPDADPADRRRLLFDDYLSAKKRLGEDIAALDFESFGQELDDLAEQLKRDKGCEDVRFDVRVVEGRVALQPRLIRSKAEAQVS